MLGGMSISSRAARPDMAGATPVSTESPVLCFPGSQPAAWSMLSSESVAQRVGRSGDSFSIPISVQSSTSDTNPSDNFAVARAEYDYVSLMISSNYRVSYRVEGTSKLQATGSGYVVPPELRGSCVVPESSIVTGQCGGI